MHIKINGFYSINFSRFFFVLFSAFFINIFIIQHDSTFQNFIGHKINNGFKKAFHCDFNCEIERIDFFQGKIILKNVSAGCLDKNWNWHIPKVSINTNFFSYVFLKKLFLKIECYDLQVSSFIKNDELKILPHIKLLIGDSGLDIPVKVKSFYVHSGKTSFLNQERDYKIDFDFLNDSLNLMNGSKSNFVIHNGIFTYKNNKNFFDTYLKIYHSCRNDKDDLDINGSFKFKGLSEQEKNCYLVGFLKNNCLKIEIQSTDNELKFKYDSGKFDGQIPLKLFMPSNSLLFIHGSKAQNKINCDFEGQLFNNLKLQGNSLYDLKKNIGDGQLNLRFDGPILNNYKIHSDCLKINFNIESNKLISDLNAKILNLKSNVEHFLNANCKADKSGINLQGNFDKDDFKLVTDSNLIIKNFEYVNSENNKLINLYSDSESKINGEITIGAISEILKRLDIARINGEGKINFKANIDYPNIIISTKMENGNVLLPFTSNIFKELESEIFLNLKTLECEIKNFSAKFLKGKILSSAIKFNLSQSGELEYLYLPLTIKNLYISWKTDFFAEVQGFLLFQYQKNKNSDVKGNIILMRSNLAGNILSQEIQKNFIAFSINPLKSYKTDALIDINLTTKTPLKVKTKFLETSAKINLDLTGNLFAPKICGAIELYKGNLNFPYAPLYISSGKIEFYPDHSNEPTLDLVAKNKIKKYNVAMTISGRPTDPQIEFESDPHMNKEEIVALLLSGSQASSLYTVMPHVLMQNLKNLVFSSENSIAKPNSGFKNFLKPLEKIRIVPSFSDQSARGGLRGKLEIDVNDRLHGLIEKNFSLSEDVKIEVEYDITDEAAIRVVRDERGDLGGEVEMRWKF